MHADGDRVHLVWVGLTNPIHASVSIGVRHGDAVRRSTGIIEQPQGREGGLISQQVKSKHSHAVCSERGVA